MKKVARDQIARIFCNNHNIQTDSIMENLKTLIAETYAPFLLFIECLDSKGFKSRDNPFDGFFIYMLHRASNVFGGMATLIASGHLQEAEALSRSLAESSLKIIHLNKGDVPSNIAQYLASYFSESSWKTKQWKTAISNCDIHPHNKLIQDKTETEEQAKEVCRMFIEAAGCKWPEKTQSISAEKLFKDLDKELEYRTVYRAMCGQPHQNPEDIVNGLLCSLSSNDKIERSRKEEKHCFSVFICLWGVRYHLESIATLAKYFSFNAALVQSNRATEAIIELQTIIHNASKECQFPAGWVRNAVDGI
ncbi:MAG: hypothetical protein IPN00_12800 [Hydrogenophilales bacterium]|nr:hypothetical protein [Hydrogenophilales bacterium]